MDHRLVTEMRRTDSETAVRPGPLSGDDTCPGCGRSTHRFLLTVTEAAESLAIGRTRLYEEIRLGRLRSVRIGSARRVELAELRRYVEVLRDES